MGIAEATTFIEDNPHPRLWKLLAEAALQKMDLATAESAFVRFSDLQGLQFVKRLKNIHSSHLQEAEISAYRGDFDAAERIYLEMERVDLAIQLRERLGDWFRVAQLMQSHTIGSDVEYEKTNTAIGDYYVDRQNWASAREYYAKSNNVEKELNCLYMLEDWDSLKAVASRLTEKHPLLLNLGHMLASVGLCVQAADALVKAGDVQGAIDVCIAQTQWAEATRLAVEHKQHGVPELLANSARQLIEAGRTLEAIDFLCKAEQYLEAAKFMYRFADEQRTKTNDIMYLKKLYVLAALIFEEKQKNKIAELSNLLETEGTSDAVLEPWRNAEAYHFMLVAQRFLHRGAVDSALTAARTLTAYEDILGIEEVHCLLALAAAASQHYATCSRSLGRLESLPLTGDRREQYETLALDLFSRNAPRDPKPTMTQCGSCLTSLPVTSASCPACRTVFPVCVASGTPLFTVSGAWTCGTCHHYALAQEIALRKTCPLCHSIA